MGVQKNGNSELASVFRRMIGRYGKLSSGHGEGRGVAADIRRAASPKNFLSYPRCGSFYEFLAGLDIGDVNGESFVSRFGAKKMARVVFMLPVLVGVSDTENIRMGEFFFKGGAVNKDQILQICRLPSSEETEDDDIKRLRGFIERTLKSGRTRKMDVIGACFDVYKWGDDSKEKIYSSYHATKALTNWKESSWKTDAV